MKSLRILNVVCPGCGAQNGIAEQHLSIAAVCLRCTDPLFSRRPVDLTSRTFFSHLRLHDIPVVVEFWSRVTSRASTVFASAAGALEPHARLARVNVEDESALSKLLHVEDGPVIALFSQGKEVARRTDRPALGPLVAWIREHGGIRADARPVAVEPQLV